MSLLRLFILAVIASIAAFSTVAKAEDTPPLPPLEGAELKQPAQDGNFMDLGSEKLPTIGESKTQEQSQGDRQVQKKQNPLTTEKPKIIQKTIVPESAASVTPHKQEVPPQVKMAEPKAPLNEVTIIKKDIKQLPEKQKEVNLPASSSKPQPNNKGGKFLNDEVTLFLAPEDDVVLGKLTERAKIEQMSLVEYANFILEKYYYDLRAEERKKIKQFIERHDR